MLAGAQCDGRQFIGCLGGAADAAVRIDGVVQAGGGSRRWLDRDALGWQRRRAETAGASENLR